MKQLIINTIKKGRDYVLYPVRYKHSRKRQFLQIAPYPIHLYEKLLIKINNSPAYNFVEFTEKKKPKAKNNCSFFVRHDIDTLSCVQNTPMFVEANKKNNIPAAFYFRTDGECYDLKDHAETVQLCKDHGFEVGLHTSCYIEDDYKKLFLKETDAFEEATGWRPQSFTVHGFGRYRWRTRKQFSKKFPLEMNQYGYSFSDCTEAIRKYDYVIEDCHTDKNKNRFIYNDFQLGSTIEGSQYLILTHPCYWTA